MFDLDAAISDWRRRAVSGGHGDRVTLTELEDHLREEFAALVRQGRGEEEAWRLASAKLGDPAVLAREFAKINRLRRTDRAAIGALLALAAAAIACVLVFIITSDAGLRAKPLLAVHVLTISLGYILGLLAAAAAAYGAVRALAARRPVPSLQGVALRVVRLASVGAAALSMLGFALGAAWAQIEWGRAFTGLPQEVAAIPVILSLMAATAATWRSALPAHVSFAVAVSSGGVILAAWFGAAGLSGGQQATLTTFGFTGLGVSLAIAALTLLAPSRFAKA
jgi:hypothetical protein